jgi:CBS domain-containing protein
MTTIDSLPVYKFASKDVKTATEDYTIQDICRLMYENDIGSIVITKRTVEGIKPVGILTERDIVRLIGMSEETFTPQTAVREIMKYPLITIDSNSTVSNAVKTMNANQIRRLLVLDDNQQMIGILTERDIFRAIATASNI